MKHVERSAAAVRVQVEDEPVHPAVDGARAEPERDRERQEEVPRRHGRHPGQAERDEQDRQRQDDSPPDPFGEQTPDHRAADVGDRVDEEEDADAGVGLVERGLDRADQRRDQQAGPADEEPARRSRGRRRCAVREGRGMGMARC